MSTRSINELHEVVVTGDGSALEKLVRQLLRHVPLLLRRSFRRLPYDQLVESAHEAITEYATHPERFDATRGISLECFVAAAASRNLLNRLKSEARRRLREAEYVRRVHARLSRVHTDDTRASLVASLLLTVLTKQEQLFLSAWLRGDDPAAALPATLLSGLTPDERRRLVKQTKERILKRLKRRAHGSALPARQIE